VGRSDRRAHPYSLWVRLSRAFEAFNQHLDTRPLRAHCRKIKGDRLWLKIKPVVFARSLARKTARHARDQGMP